MSSKTSTIMAKPRSAGAVQNFLTIDSIRDGIITLKDGGQRMVLMASSINFALKAADEQDAVTYQYQNFLNSIDFPVQFIVHSRKLNIAPYLESLKEREKTETNELLKIQISEYVNFVKSFVELTNIISKTFYVVVPFFHTVIEKTGVLGKILPFLGGGQKKIDDKSDKFEEFKVQIQQRADNVALGLQRFGIRTAPLNTEELIELLYGLYNPTEFEKGIAPGEL